MMKGLFNFLRWPRKRKPVSGITVFILQRKLQRFTDEQLSSAMQRAWGRKYDGMNFYGVSTFDGEGGLLKMDAMFFTMQHFDRKVDSARFGERELPHWAEHHAYTSFGYVCPGGLPPGQVRDKLGWLIGRFCGELLAESTSALFFVEANVLVPFTPAFDQALRANFGKSPEDLFNDVDAGNQSVSR